MAEFLDRYGSEDQCEAALFAARWPQGWRCPSCDCPWYSSFLREGRRYWQCGAYRHQSTLTSGTIFEATKVSVRSRPFFPVETATPTMVSTTNGSGHHETREP
jgi:hypothetical protein